jgi:hypothetical protein
MIRVPVVFSLLLLSGCGQKESVGDSTTDSSSDTSTTEEITEELHLLVTADSVALLDLGWELASLPVSGDLDDGGNYDVFVDSDDPDRICSEVVFGDGERAGPCVKGGSGSLMEGVGDYRVTLTVF